MYVEEHAVRILGAVDRSMLDARHVIEDYFSRRPELSAIRRAVTSLVFGTLRNYMLLDRVARALGIGGPPWSRRVVLFEAIFRDVSLKRVEEVALHLNVTGPIREARHMDLDTVLPSNPTDRLAVKYSMPRWIVEYALRRIPEPVGFLESLNRRPPMWLRARVDPEKLARELEVYGVEARIDGEIPHALKVVRGNPVNTPAFKEGKFYVMDKASQAAVYVLGDVRRSLVLDVTSAPGGKAIHAADQGARVVGFDISHRRLKEEVRLASRYGADIDLAIADSATLPVRGLTAKVLVDPDCTSLGRMAHSPEIRLWVRPFHVRRLARLQRRLLGSIAGRAERGTEIVYTTCTVTFEENEENARWVSEELGLEHVEVDVGLKSYVGSRLYPHIHDTEGFYIAKFVKG